METKSNELLSKDEKYIWHALRRHHPGASSMVVTEANGAWIKDSNGNEYLHGMSELWCVNVGYGREELAKAAYDQMKVLTYYPIAQSHIQAIELGEKLKERLDGEYIIVFSKSESEANETALILERQIH